MAIAEIVGELVQSLFQAIGEVVFRIPGVLIVRHVFRRQEVDPDGCMVFTISAACWGALGYGMYCIFW